MEKYIFMDIDRTLTNSNGEISNNNIEAMQEIVKKNTEIIFTSGRCNYHLMEIRNKCGCGRYLISSNGSMIYDMVDEKIIYKSVIDTSILEKVFKYCLDNRLALDFNTDKCRFCNKYYNYKNEDKDIVVIDSLDEVDKENITQFIIGSYDYQKMIDVKKYLANFNEVEIVNSSTTLKQKKYDSKKGFFYDVVNKGINKGIGIRQLIKLLNISKDQCIAIGDHTNDLPMFEEVGYKIAMGNAYQELKDKADYITKTNDEDGVEYALCYLEKEFNRQ